MNFFNLKPTSIIYVRSWKIIKKCHNKIPAIYLEGKERAYDDITRPNRMSLFRARLSLRRLLPETT